LVDATVADVVGPRVPTRHRTALSQEGVAGGHVRHVSEVGGLDPGSEIEVARRIHHGPGHCPVLRAAEEIDPVPVEAGEWIDHLPGRELLRLGQQSELVRLAEKRLHALIERSHDAALGTVIRPAGHHSSPGDPAGECDLDLHRHKGSARET
jgi:hypothetical protein